MFAPLFVSGTLHLRLSTSEPVEQRRLNETSIENPKPMWPTVLAPEVYRCHEGVQLHVYRLLMILYNVQLYPDYGLANSFWPCDWLLNFCNGVNWNLTAAFSPTKTAGKLWLRVNKYTCHRKTSSHLHGICL